MKTAGIIAGGVLLVVIGVYLTLDNNQAGKKMVVPAGSAVGGDLIKEEKVQQASLEEKYGEYARLTIPYLRAMELAGSEIKIIQTHQVRSGYVSYIASYESEGLTIRGLLTKPSGEMPDGGFPAVVFLHGYIQPDIYNTTERYDDYIDYLARNGIVVYKIDYRGHDKSDGVPSGAYYSGDYVIDAINAYASMSRLDYVNREKIGLWGHSMSGNVVMRAMAVENSISRGVILAGAVYSYLDMQKYRINDQSFVRDREIPSSFLRRSQNLFEKVGNVTAENEFWQMVAPINYLSDFDGAIQLHHASNDEVVNVGYSSDLAEELKSSGVEYELFVYNSGGHNLVSPAFGQVMARTVEFLKN